MTSLLIISSFIALILLIWFKTDAFLEYCLLFNIENWFKFNEYKYEQIAIPSLTYTEFLRMKYDTFVIKLITCPICLSVWLSIICGIIISSFVLIPIICLLSLTIYGTINKLY
jgi:hypothetical protein